MENILPADKSVGERRSTIEIMNADVMALSRSPALAFVHSPPNFLSLSRLCFIGICEILC